MRIYVIEVKWGISRGRDTDGYTTCGLYANGRKMASCSGGGYDLRGTVFGDFLEKEFQPELLKMPREGRLYGSRLLTDKGKEKISLDGACGQECMEQVIRVMGGKLETLKIGRGRKAPEFYTLTMPDPLEN